MPSNTTAENTSPNNDLKYRYENFVLECEIAELEEVCESECKKALSLMQYIGERLVRADEPRIEDVRELIQEARKHEETLREHGERLKEKRDELDIRKGEAVRGEDGRVMYIDPF